MSTLKQQRKNRLALAEMLEDRVTDKQFNMSQWTNECGTVGCALGIAVLSGEFGYGWHPDCFGGDPVKAGKIVGWDDVADDLFGRRAWRDVFTGYLAESRVTRQTVAAELRAIK